MIFIPPPYLNKNIREAVKFDVNEEIWLPINYKEHSEVRQVYFVSSYGRVFSNGKVNFNFPESKYLKMEISDTGYYRVSLIDHNGIPHHYAVHRLVMEAFCPIENMSNFIVNHLNYDQLDNHLWNLEWTDDSGNCQHAIYNGLVHWKTGDDCSWASINSEKADQIAYMISTKAYKYYEIANLVGCKNSVVTNIANGISWRDSYIKYKLYYLRNSIKPVFSNDQKAVLLEYIKENISKYDNSYYRPLCMDACKDLFGIKVINRAIYIEVMDIILIYLDSINESV